MAKGNNPEGIEYRACIMGCMQIKHPACGAAQVHTVPTKVTGKCGSVTVRLIPAPRGAGIVAARVPKKVLQMAGIEDCYTCSRGSTKTLGNFVKARSTMQACAASGIAAMQERSMSLTSCH